MSYARDKRHKLRNSTRSHAPRSLTPAEIRQENELLFQLALAERPALQGYGLCRNLVGNDEDEDEDEDEGEGKIMCHCGEPMTMVTKGVWDASRGDYRWLPVEQKGKH